LFPERVVSSFWDGKASRLANQKGQGKMKNNWAVGVPMEADLTPKPSGDNTQALNSFTVEFEEEKYAVHEEHKLKQ